MGIGIEADAVGIPASGISVRYRTGSPYSEYQTDPALAFFSILYRTDGMPDSTTKNLRMWKGIQPARSRPHCQWSMEYWLYDYVKSEVNAGMPGKKLIRHRYFNCYSHLCQSGIGIPASGSVRYRLSRISPALPNCRLHFTH